MNGAVYRVKLSWHIRLKDMLIWMPIISGHEECQMTPNGIWERMTDARLPLLIWYRWLAGAVCTSLRGQG